MTEIQRRRFKEEQLIIMKCQSQDEHALEFMIQKYLPYIKKIANKYTHQLPFEDLVQEGMMGLIDGIHHYDVNKGNLFSTYATFWIKKNMLRAIDDTAHTIRIPVYITNLRRKIKKILRNKPNTSKEMLAALTQVPLNQIDYALEGIEMTELNHDILSDTYTPHDAYLLELMESTYDTILQTLSKIEHDILVHRYEDSKMSYQQLSKLLNISIRHVKKHEASMKEKITNAYNRI